MFLLQLAIVFLMIIIGARFKGVGLGVFGGLGLLILVFGFNLEPSHPPIDVILMIAAVVTASSVLEAAGGLNFLVEAASRFLRRNPERISYYGPLIAFLFSFFAGTGHVVYSVLPIIAEVARKSGVRPERPLSVSVIASQQAITASPISAATVAMLSLLAPLGVCLPQILMITIPATLGGLFAAALVMSRYGEDLAIEDNGPLAQASDSDVRTDGVEINHDRRPAFSVLLFCLTIVAVVVFGAFPSIRPSWPSIGKQLGMAELIQILMLSCGALTMLSCNVVGEKIISGQVFKAGMQAVIAIFGVAWLGDTFFAAHRGLIASSVENVVVAAPGTFALALFVFSIFLFSQAATVRALLPLGLAIGLAPAQLIAMIPAVNGYFFLPNYPTALAAISFDTTGSTRIGKYFLNHSFMLPGIVAVSVSILIGFSISKLVF